MRIILAIGVGLLLFSRLLVQLYRFSQDTGSQHYSHFVLIPLIAGYFVFVQRKRLRQVILEQKEGPPDRYTAIGQIVGAGITTLSLLIYLAEASNGPARSLNDHLALMTASFVLYVAGAFLWVFGPQAFLVVRFPLLFLAFIIPVPDFVLHHVVLTLQTASAAVADFLFTLTGTVYLRDGFFFSLPGLNIEVAAQCSGIRSSLSLLIVSILAGHTALRTTWGKLVLVLAVFPITVFKNGIRIVLLSLLAMHWDPAIMSGSLHTTGGIPFFVVAMTLLSLVVWGIRRAETQRTDPIRLARHHQTKGDE